MIKKTLKITTLILTACCLFACGTTHLTPYEMSKLAQSKRLFDDGYYKRAMHELLPLASNGNPQAQYAIGYMYYYGLGVTQDTDTGHFWVQKAAEKNYPPAIEGLKLMVPSSTAIAKPRDKLLVK